MGKIHPISLKLNFTPNFMGCYGLIKMEKSLFLKIAQKIGLRFGRVILYTMKRTKILFFTLPDVAKRFDLKIITKICDKNLLK